MQLFLKIFLIMVATVLGSNEVLAREGKHHLLLPSPPNTAQGNYAVGCNGGSCLQFDDHWTSSSLNTANWYPGIAICNNGSTGNGQNCGSLPGEQYYLYPLSSPCWGAINGCQDFATYDWPYGYGTNSPPLTHKALSVALDGSLAFSVMLYSSTVYPTASTNVLASNPYCTHPNCSFIYWTGAAITAGGLTCPTCYPAAVNNPAAIIPANGGYFQWTQKLDLGLLHGAYPAMECDAVGGSGGGTSINANVEFGYTTGASPLKTVGLSINNTANGVVNVTTGDFGAGSGDLTNWHTFGIEWTGTADSKWHWYIDNSEQPATVHVETVQPTIGWNCKLALGIAQNQTNGGFHTLWDAGHPGPYYMYVGDVRVYKRPGT